MLGEWIEYRMYGLELCGVAKGVNESVLRWFGHIERLKNDMINKRVYVVECG